MTRRSIHLLLPVLTIAALASCSDDHQRAAAVTVPAAVTPVATSPDADPLPGAGTTVEVAALDNVFQEDAITIQAGATVHFTNKGRNDHDVMPAVGDAWGVAKTEFTPGAEYSVSFEQPGTYVYVCSIHGLIKDGKPIGMAGTIEVTA